MKPQILITMHYMELGGVETALVGLLQALDPNRVDVDLFIYSHQGPMMQHIPKWINILPEENTYSYLEKPIFNTFKAGCWGIALARLWAKLMISIQHRPRFSSDVYTSKYTKLFLSPINSNVQYDLAISFLTPHTYVKDKVNAKKKIAWIHTDYSKYPIDIETELPVWKTFDHIASISKDVTKTFLQVFPSLTPKIIEIKNILSSKFVINRANETDVSNELQQGQEVTLLSIGRFCDAKNYDNVPDICRRVVKAGSDVRWFIIGYGDDTLIRQRIKESGMQDRVIILGKRTNPYPYIKACDIYVQPSRYEGNSVTVREAQMLCKPVIITNYATAHSQVKDGYDGVIVNMDNEGCAQGIAKLILDVNKRNHIIEYLKSHDYNNVIEANKIYSMLGL